MDLTTAASVNARRGRAATDDEALIGDLIAELSADVLAYLNRHTEAVSRTELYTLEYDQRNFRLRGFPVTSVAAVSMSTDIDFVAGEILAADAYQVDLATGRIHLTGIAAPYEPTYIQVQYTGGMAADTASFRTAFPDIAGAVDAQVIELLKRSDSPGVTETRLRDGGVSYEGAVNLLPLLKRRLDQHRRCVVL